jgi:thiamine biosynthesis protein ThiS
MEFILNGDRMTLDQPCTLSELIDRLELNGRLAVEINHRIVPRSEYSSCVINDGDRIEIVRAIGGG